MNVSTVVETHDREGTLGPDDIPMPSRRAVRQTVTPLRRARIAVAVLVAVITCGCAPTTDPGRRTTPMTPDVISGPYAALLAGSTDLGPATGDGIQLTAALHPGSRPNLLMAWAQRHGLSVRWRHGDTWAFLEGRPAVLADALDVAVHDYRGRHGQVFYASPQQPSVPVSLRDEVAELGRILGYTPHHESRPVPPLDVPDAGLTPDALLRTYNIESLRERGYTGKGITVVVFAFDGFDQADLDMFAATFGLPAFTPEVVGGQPPSRRGEAAMDLQAIHAIAPDAKKVLVNALPTVQGGGSYEKIAEMMQDTSRRYPGAVWSLSIGWGCDRLITAADLVPVRAALVAAHRTGTTAFDASGDLAGRACKDEWAAPPSPDDIGLDAVASMPEMTSVGGTTLSTDASGVWLAEQAWFDAPLTQGSGGGVSALFDRPDWQRDLDVGVGGGQRLTPDVAAVADPVTGVKFVFNQQVVVGGGTSLSAPIWAGLTAVMNQFIIERGGTGLGDLNPLLYQVARDQTVPAFRDITLGANAVAFAKPGFDLVTGLGSPNVEALAQSLLEAQKSAR